MAGKILYTTAVDSSGTLVGIESAVKGVKYFCPICKEALIVKKSGNTSPKSKRPHFAHTSLTHNCTPEGVLHYAFKHALSDKLKMYIKTKTPLRMLWHCNHCENEHSGDLIKKAHTVQQEFNMSVCRPDIALLDKDGRVFAVIEVVVTHAPEANALSFYNENDIHLIQFNINSNEDMKLLDEEILKPSYVACCFNPRCKKCNNYMHKKELVVVEDSCYKCKQPMKISYMLFGGNCPSPPSRFTEDEVSFAKSKGVLLKLRFSRTMEESYVANSCSRCSAFIGDFFMYRYWYSDNQVKYDAGWSCNCG